MTKWQRFLTIWHLMTNCLTTTALCQSDKCSVTTTEQRCVLTISVPLGVGEAPVENSWGSYEIKNVTQKKLVLFGTFRWIPYIHKIWSISIMNLHVQDLIRQKWFFGQMQKLKISISKIKSHMLIKATDFNFLHIF